MKSLENFHREIRLRLGIFGSSRSACGLGLRILGRMLHLVPGVLCFPLHLMSRVFDLGLGLIGPLFDLTLGTPYCTVHLAFYLTFIHDSWDLRTWTSKSSDQGITNSIPGLIFSRLPVGANTD